MDQELRLRVLEKIKPTKEEELYFEKQVWNLIDILKISAEKLGFDVDFLVGGSFGKKTYLKGTFDVDIFTRFNLKYDDLKLSKYTKEILDYSKIKYLKQKGSRDYFSGFFGDKNKIYFELVPNYKIEKISDAKNTTDFSPLHLLFLKEKIKENPRLCDEIRLAKQYFKSNGLYGAESYINGFSGHTIDLLIIYYKSLEKLIFNGKNWNEETIIDINKIYLNEDDLKKNINSSKHSNLIIVDPIDSKRNASRALSSQMYSKFILTCLNQNEFTLNDFKIKKISFDEMILKAKKFEKESGTFCLMYRVDFSLNEQSQDIVGTKMLKLFEKISNFFVSFDFNIFSQNFHLDMANNSGLFIYFIKQRTIPKLKLIVGPKIFLTNAVLNFSKGKKFLFIENSKICYYQKRNVINIEEISNIDVKICKKLFFKDLNCLKKIQNIK